MSREEDLCTAAWEGDVERVKALLAAGANPNTIPEGQIFNALHAAIEDSDPENDEQEVIATLLESGANPNSIAETGWTALQQALDNEIDIPWQRHHSSPSCATITRMLLEAGADPNLHGPGTRHPLAIASLHPLAAELLRQYGAIDPSETGAAGE